MKRTLKFRTLTLTAAAALLSLAPSAVSACPSCYGNATGPMFDGLNAAILAMVGITGFVLTGFSAWFVNVIRRTKNLRRTGTPDGQ
jgi:hypothetical protein